MAKYQFGDRVRTEDGREAIVQEDQEEDSTEVKIMIEGDDFAHVFEEEKLEKISDL